MPSSECLTKLDPRSRRRLATGSLEGTLEALLRTERPMTPSQEQELHDAGWQARSKIGTVVSGTILDPDHIVAVARLPFVRQVEISQPMYEEVEEL